jgi:hypothetical protein
MKNPIDGGAIGFIRMITTQLLDIMTDRTPQQVDMTLDRVEQISAQNTANIAEMQTYISQFVRAVDQRLQEHNEWLQAHDALMAKQDSRIAILEDAQLDTKEMLRILIERTTGP